MCILDGSRRLSLIVEMVVGEEGEKKLPFLVLLTSKVLEIVKNQNAFMCYYYNFLMLFLIKK